jgi:hypothetical protein
MLILPQNDPLQWLTFLGIPVLYIDVCEICGITSYSKFCHVWFNTYLPNLTYVL